MIKDLGVQLYTIRAHLNNAEQIRDSFKKLHDMGYVEMQTAGGWPVSAEELRSIADATGTKIIGSHISFEEIYDETEKVMREHEAYGAKYIGVGSISPRYMSGADGILEFIEKVNEVSETLFKNGFKFTYHHHSFEFRRFGEKRMLDMLVEGLNPKTTSFVLDTYWIQHGGGDVIEWMEKLRGRIDILHLKDMGIDEKGQFDTEVLEGNMNFDSIMDAAKEIGISHYVVEQDNCPGDPFVSLKKSSENIFARYSNK